MGHMLSSAGPLIFFISYVRLLARLKGSVLVKGKKWNYLRLLYISLASKVNLMISEGDYSFGCGTC